jgi:hypothetical protein
MGVMSEVRAGTHSAGAELEAGALRRIERLKAAVEVLQASGRMRCGSRRSREPVP